MAQKHLKELLKEDQEPFFLKDYIADKQCLIKKQTPKTQRQQQQQIQLKKPKSMSKNTSIFSKNACFFSLQESPDLRKSPLFDFLAASPVSKKSPNRVFLHVPAKTASMLLEAAMRIQKQSKPNNKIKNSTSFGLFGSMLKRLNLRNRTHKIKSNEIDNKNSDECTTNICNVLVGVDEQKVAIVSCSSCSYSSSSSSSSCTNEVSSSVDFESSSSGRSFEDDDDDEDDGFEFANVLRENNNNINGDYGALCLSPLSPFRFALHKNPSTPPKSPACRKFEDIIKYEEESSVKCQQVEEDEEDKEQNSPVSVLDPPFEDDYDAHHEDYYDDNQDCSYAFVQRAKQQLLHKLHRFEKLAELDPIELEKRMIEDEEDEDENEDSALEQEDDINIYDYQSFTFSEPRQMYTLLNDVVTQSGNRDIKKPGIKRLISDLIIEEESIVDEIDNEQIIKRVCNRLESWREVKCNTIDMMIEMDLRSEVVDWKKPQRSELSETATDIEVAIFAALVNEVAEDLAFSC